MKEEGKEERKPKIEFIRLIGTWPGGSDYVECEYKVIFEKEIVRLHLQLIEECSDYEEMGKASQEEINESFKRNREGQEKFFREEGKKIVREVLMRVGEIEGMRKLGCNKIPSSYVPEIATIIIRSIKKRN